MLFTILHATFRKHQRYGEPNPRYSSILRPAIVLLAKADTTKKDPDTLRQPILVEAGQPDVKLNVVWYSRTVLIDLSIATKPRLVWIYRTTVIFDNAGRRRNALNDLLKSFSNEFLQFHNIAYLLALKL